MKKVSEYTLPRTVMYGVGTFIGIIAGFVNSYLNIDFGLTPKLFISLLAAVIVVVFLHEGIHGAVAAIFGHKPRFGLDLPLVYITFDNKIPKPHFILVALAPLLVLDALFIVLLSNDIFRLFSDLSLITNTIGAIGDVWIVFKLLGAPKGALIQDTKTGIEVWVADKT